MTTPQIRYQVFSNENSSAREVDIVVESYFSIYLLRPLTSAGREWLKSHVADGRPMVRQCTRLRMALCRPYCERRDRRGSRSGVNDAVSSG